MAKTNNTVFFCSECGYETAKWAGQCPACHQWGTLVEAPAAPKSAMKPASRGASARRGGGPAVRPMLLQEIESSQGARCPSGFSELDRVLGGGIVSGSLILIGGDPGIGKSTLLLQLCRNVAAAGKKVLYISGEESLQQIRLRASRIGELTGDLRFLSETDLDDILELLQKEQPEILVIDSIQTMFCEEIPGSPGSVSQVREVTSRLLQTAKSLSIATFIVGHMTKDGQVAGPRMLEHMVDTVLYFEGERSASYRVIRAVKNRFGSTNEIGVFEMREEGLTEVANPSQYLLSERPEGSSGTVVSCSMEGTRPILAEVQSLVIRSNFGSPRRTAVGADHNRVSLLMAVIEKRLHLPMSEYDAFVNITGGMRMQEPALDLAIVMAIVSSFRDHPVDEKTVIFGEVGLSGEVRAVSQAEQRVKEAARLGFTRCILPKSALAKIRTDDKILCIGVSSIGEAMHEILQ